MRNLKKLTKIFFFLLLISCSESEIAKKNFIIILADDLGYSDLGSFGSEINTPNIDMLAQEGVIMSNFHTSPLCAPSRAMLLSGNDNHIAGIGIQAFSSENFGYEGKLSERVKIIPEVLQKSGYKSFISGKWHIGGDPYERGFNNSYSLLPGAFTHYDNNKPIEAYPDSSFSQNGKRVLWPEGEYSTDFYTQKMIDFIKSNHDKSICFLLSKSNKNITCYICVSKNIISSYNAKNLSIELNTKFNGKGGGNDTFATVVLNDTNVDKIKTFITEIIK